MAPAEKQRRRGICLHIPRPVAGAIRQPQQAFPSDRTAKKEMTRNALSFESARKADVAMNGGGVEIQFVRVSKTCQAKTWV